MGANLNGRRLSLYELGQSQGLAPPSHGYTIEEKVPGLPSHLAVGVLRVVQRLLPEISDSINQIASPTLGHAQKMMRERRRLRRRRAKERENPASVPEGREP